MPKVVINADFGGFSLSPLALEMYYKRARGLEEVYWFEYDFSTESFTRVERDSDALVLLAYDIPNPDSNKDEGALSPRDIPRDDPALVAVVEELGSQKAGGRHANLRVVEVPDDVKWHIAEYDGLEHVAEDHRSWY